MIQAKFFLNGINATIELNQTLNNFLKSPLKIDSMCLVDSHEYWPDMVVVLSQGRGS